MILTIGKKLSLAFGAILLLMAISSLITYSLILDNEKIQQQVVNLRMKTVLLGKDVTNGINESLAALRGYIILGKEPEKAQQLSASRQVAWDNIDTAINQYDSLAQHWTVPKNVRRLETIKAELTQFKAAQQEIEDISHSDNNIPSYQLLLTQAAPKAASLLQDITNIIDEESTLEATPARKQLLKNLADTRGSFAIGLANIRAYLLSGDENFKIAFAKQWQVNEQRVTSINSTQTAILTEVQMAYWQSFMHTWEQFKPLPEKMFTLRSANDWNKANAWLGTKAAPRASKVLTLLEEMKRSQQQLLAADAQESMTVVQTLKTTLILATVISLIIGIGSATIFSKDLLQRLSIILDRAKNIAAGDMTGQKLVIKGNDELANLTLAINQMSDSLSSLVRKTADSMVDASKGSSEILVANQEMASGIKEQFNQIEQIATAVEELSNSSIEVARNCNDASESSSCALKLAQTGGEIVQETLSHMVSIKDAFDISSGAVTSLSTQSKQIEDILTVIKGVADQTNLLALNAAIEAARAGEQGRGFAVVADEVRQLAGRTTAATTEVESAIEAMRRETENAVTMMAEGSKKVDYGVEMSNNAASSLVDIIASVGDVEAKIQAIAATAEEQTMVTTEIAQNTESVSTVTQQIQTGVNSVVILSDSVSQNTTSRANSLLAMI